jgi:hypothetical protein
VKLRFFPQIKSGVRMTFYVPPRKQRENCHPERSEGSSWAISEKLVLILRLDTLTYTTKTDKDTRFKYIKAIAI